MIANCGIQLAISSKAKSLLSRFRTNVMSRVPAGTLATYTNQISALRAKLSLAAIATAPNPDDFGLAVATASLAGTTTVNRSQIVDADANVIAFSRNTTQVLNIVTGGNATTSGTKASGVFFPNGLNGLFS